MSWYKLELKNQLETTGRLWNNSCDWLFVLLVSVAGHSGYDQFFSRPRDQQSASSCLDFSSENHLHGRLSQGPLSFHVDSRQGDDGGNFSICPSDRQDNWLSVTFSWQEKKVFLQVAVLINCCQWKNTWAGNSKGTLDSPRRSVVWT